MTTPKEKPAKEHESGMMAKPRPTSRELAAALDKLERAEGLGMDRASAVLLLGYLTVRRNLDGEPIGWPGDVVAFATSLRGQPMLWSALRATDYIRLARSLVICGQPPASSQDLQKSCGDIERWISVGDPAPAPQGG